MTDPTRANAAEGSGPSTPVTAELASRSRSGSSRLPSTPASPSLSAPPNPNAKTIVIKLGTSSILSESNHQPKLSILSSIVEVCHELRRQGHRVIIVCSGAIGMGRLRMGITSKPKAVPDRQALAALGQLRLMALWDSLFTNVGLNIAQVLLTRADIADETRYMNARATLHTLLSDKYSAIPIVNENDTVSVDELRFGDNDKLSAITADLVEADYLFLCTDVDGLYTSNPTTDPNAKRLDVVSDLVQVREAVHVSNPGSNFGTGGMQTKLDAAELAHAAGVATFILNGSVPTNILKLVAAEIAAPTTGTLSYDRSSLPAHTLFLARPRGLSDERRRSVMQALHGTSTPPWV
ncbi:Glutamate 5-kinase [Tilletia horrida]|uniref:Glutamate 5-kinase n=1 Tax=Tilletia horrida TaxID=155126 RepID=A0AAN6GVZ0_9BASI|nr:Glutamate 5-kinase [Tilletia horrida]